MRRGLKSRGKLNIGGGAGEARRAVGIGETGGLIEAGAERVERIVGADVDIVVGRSIERRREAAGEGTGVVSHELAEEFGVLIELVAQDAHEIEAVSLRQRGFVVVGVLIPIDGEIVDVVRRERLAEPGVSVGQGDEIEGAVGRQGGRGAAGRGDDAAIAGGAGTDEGTGGIVAAAQEAAEVARIGAQAVVEIVVAHDDAGGIGDGQTVPRSGDVAGGADVLIAGKLALIQPEEIAVEEIEGEEEVAAAGVEGVAVGDFDVPLVAPAVLGEAAAAADRAAVEIPARDRVDDAAGGVGAVDRGGPVAQDLHAGHRGGGELVDVDGERRHAALGLRNRMRGHAPAVEEHEGVAGADTAEVDGVVVAAGVGTEGVALVEHDGAADGQGVEDLGGRGHAAQIKIVGADHRDRERRLLIDAFNIRTGDREGLHRDGVRSG